MKSLSAPLIALLLFFSPSSVLAEACAPGEASFLFSKNTPELRFSSHPIPTPHDFDWKRSIAPFGGGSGGRQLVNLGGDGKFHVMFPGADPGVERFGVPSLRDCTGVNCQLYSYDVDRDGGEDLVVQEEKEGKLYLIFSRSPDRVYELGFFQGRLIGMTADESGEGTKLVSYNKEAIYENLLTSQGVVKRERSYPSRYAPCIHRVYDSSPAYSPRLIGAVSGSPISSVIMLPLDGNEASAVMVGDFQPSYLPWNNSIWTLDANGDGLKDFLVGAPPSRNFWVGVSSPAGYFEAPVSGMPVPTEQVKIVAAADFSGDGFDDVLLYDEGKDELILSESKNVERLAAGRLTQGTKSFELSAGAEVCAEENLFAEHSQLSYSGGTYVVVSRLRDRAGRTNVLLRELGKSGEKFSLDTSPQGPFLCNGYHPDPKVERPELLLSKWGRRDTNCPAGYGFYFSQEVVKEETSKVDVKISCCPLPNSDILLDHQVESDGGCPDNFVAVGSRSLDRSTLQSKKKWLCQEIAPRYQLGKDRGGVYMGRGYSFRGHKERVRTDQIPAAIRTAATRQVFNFWDGDGCVGSPPGSLLVSRQDGKGCERMRFRELQYSGFPGDPPKGTPVQMFPKCKGINDPYRPDARCVF